MKHASAILCGAILISLALGCSQFKRDNAGATGNSTSTTTTTSPSPADPEDISGAYDITGMNENGAVAYKGTLMVTNRGDVYQFSWDTAGKKYEGVGVKAGDHIGVAFAAGDNGEGCGVVLYNIGADGTLDGKAGYWGNNSSETETANRMKGTDLVGEYETSGTNTAGQDYEGKLVVKKSGAGYTFSWSAGSTFEGFGIRQDDTVTVGFGGDKCGFASYVRQVNGRM